MNAIPTREQYYADPELNKVYSLPGKDVNYGPTPEPVIERLLDLLQIGPDSVVLDPGCGDGRVLIKAAQRGAMGIGVESCRERYALACKLSFGMVRGHWGRTPLVFGDFRSFRFDNITHLIAFMWPGVVEQVIEHVAKTTPRFTVASIVHCPYPGERQSIRHELGQAQRHIGCGTTSETGGTWPVFVYQHTRDGLQETVAHG